jgi:hypothetical protein
LEREIRLVRDFDDWELEEVFSHQTCESCHFYDEDSQECWLENKVIASPNTPGCRDWMLHKSLEARIEKFIDNHEAFGS